MYFFWKVCVFLLKNHEKKNGGNVHLGQTIEAIADMLYCRLRADIVFDQPLDNSCSSTTFNDKGYDKFTVCFITQVYWNVIWIHLQVFNKFLKNISNRSFYGHLYKKSIY